MIRNFLVIATHRETGIADYWWLENEEELRRIVKDVLEVGGQIEFAGEIKVVDDFTEEFAIE